MAHFVDRVFTGQLNGSGSFSSTNGDCTFTLDFSGPFTATVTHNPDGTLSGTAVATGNYTTTSVSGTNCILGFTYPGNGPFSVNLTISGTPSNIVISGGDFPVVNFTGSLNEITNTITGTAVITLPGFATGQAQTNVSLDGPPDPTLSINDVTVDEDAGTATFTITRSGDDSGEVTVNYATADGSALAGEDYTAITGIVTFAPGITTQTITVDIIDDNVIEDPSSETFEVNLSGASGAAIADAQGIGTINDDDLPISDEILQALNDIVTVGQTSYIATLEQMFLATSFFVPAGFAAGNLSTIATQLVSPNGSTFTAEIEAENYETVANYAAPVIEFIEQLAVRATQLTLEDGTVTGTARHGADLLISMGTTAVGKIVSTELALLLGLPGAELFVTGTLVTTAPTWGTIAVVVVVGTTVILTMDVAAKFLLDPIIDDFLDGEQNESQEALQSFTNQNATNESLIPPELTINLRDVSSDVPPVPAWTFNLDTDELTGTENIDSEVWDQTAQRLGLDDGASTDGIVINGDGDPDTGNRDPLVGSSGHDVISGGLETDALFGGRGDDTLNGGPGDDVLAGGAGNDTVNGGIGNDLIFADGIGNQRHFDGGEGSDTITYQQTSQGVTVDLLTASGQQFVEIVPGTAIVINDTIVNIENVVGSTGSDTIVGNGAGNLLRGLEGNDFLEAGAGNDTVDGGAGNDTIVGGDGAGNDFYDGGDDIDTLVYTSTTLGISVHLANGFATGTEIDVDTITNIENVITGSGQDAITGNDVANVLSGGDERDTIFGRGGNDTLNGDAGNDALFGQAGLDTLNGGTGNDVLFGGDDADILNGGDDNDVLRGEDGDDTLNGDAGDDTLLGEGGADALNGGDDVDTANYVLSPSAVTVSLLTGTGSGGFAEGDTLSGIERLRGSFHDDFLTGDNEDNLIQGLPGGDTISGAGGNDLVFGGPGDDTINGDAGVDALFGQAGADIINGGDERDVIFGGDEGDTLNGDDGNDVLLGEAGDDTLNGGEGHDSLLGGNGADDLNGGNGFDLANYVLSSLGVNVSLATGTGSGGDAEGDTLTSIENLRGSNHADTLTGDDGSNQIRGLAGNDIIQGNGGVDVLFGNDGEDTLNGGSGTDFLNGGNDDDLYIIEDGTGIDHLIGFEAGQGSDDVADISDFSFADFNAVLLAANDVGSDVHIQLDADDVLIIRNVLEAELHQDDFLI